MAAARASLAMLVVGVAASGKRKLKMQGQFMHFLTYGDFRTGCHSPRPCLTAPYDQFPYLNVAYYPYRPYVGNWLLPEDGRPGPIRYGFGATGCLTVNDSLSEKFPPARAKSDFVFEVRRLYLAPCNGNPSQDFIMPDQEWMQGCGGPIKWAIDPRFQLSVLASEAVLRKQQATSDELWYVTFWDRAYVLASNVQRMLLNACSGTALVLLLFQVFRLLRACCLALKLFVGAGQNGCMGTCLAPLTRAQQLFRSISKGRDAEVLSLYNSRRLARVQAAMWLMQPVLSLIFLGNMRSRPNEMIWSFFEPLEEQDPNGIIRALASTGLLPCVVLFAWATFFSACPRLLTARGLDCSHVALTVTWILQFGAVREKSRNGYNDTMAWMDIMQVLTATVLGNAAVATPMQVILSAVQIHSHIRSNLSGGTYSSSHEVTHQLVLLALFLAFIWLMDWETWREAEATVKAQRADCSCSMVTRLLGSMCDAVVQVDKSFCIGAAGSPQLAALLMHQGSHAGPPLQGASLMRLVKNEDHQRFEDFMMRELAAARAGFGAQAPIASSLQVCMRDALNIPVPVELFCSCSLGAEGSGIGPLQYLLGIREQEASPVMEGRQQTKESESMTREHGRTFQEHQATRTQQLDQMSESDNSRSDMRSVSSMLRLDMSAWVDLSSEQLTVLRWSPGFASLLQQHSPEGAGFLNWLVQEQRQGFVAWLQETATERTSTESSRAITLRLPRQGASEQGREKLQKRRFTCTVFEGAEELPETSNPSEVRAVRLDLHEHRRRRLAR